MRKGRKEGMSGAVMRGEETGEARFELRGDDT